jgi:hypothetical protein
MFCFYNNISHVLYFAPAVFLLYIPKDGSLVSVFSNVLEMGSADIVQVMSISDFTLSMLRFNSKKSCVTIL